MSPLICRSCGSEFPDTRPSSTRGRKPGYCSDSCRKAAVREYNRVFRAERRLLGQCIFCPQGSIADSLPGSDLCAEHKARSVASTMKTTLARYGLDADGLAALYVRQAGLCAICGASEAETGKRHAIDHDHACCPGDRSCGSCVRGLLCGACNTGIGLFRDRSDVLARAAAYVST